MSERYKWTNFGLLGKPQSVTPGIPDGVAGVSRYAVQDAAATKDLGVEMLTSFRSQ